MIWGCPYFRKPPNVFGRVIPCLRTGFSTLLEFRFACSPWDPWIIGYPTHGFAEAGRIAWPPAGKHFRLLRSSGRDRKMELCFDLVHWCMFMLWDFLAWFQSIYIDILVQICTYLYIYTHIFTYIYIYLHTITYVYMYLHIFTYIYICITYFYIRICCRQRLEKEITWRASWKSCKMRPSPAEFSRDSMQQILAVATVRRPCGAKLLKGMRPWNSKRRIGTWKKASEKCSHGGFPGGFLPGI